jgi:FXSXX-COOH protein
VSITTPERPVLVSLVTDVRRVPLGQLPQETVDAVLGRLFPETSVAPVAVSEFNSSIG